VVVRAEMAALWPIENDDPLWGFILNDDPMWGFISPHGYLPLTFYFCSKSSIVHKSKLKVE
jgi:hypothetical protein